MKPPYFIKTIKRITKYQDHVRRIAFLREEIERLQPKTTPVYSLAPAPMGTSDQTGDTAGSIVDKQRELFELENEVFLIDLAIGQLSEPKQFIIKLKYIEGNKDKYVQRLLKKEHGVKSKDTYYRLKDEAVEELAKMFGFYLDGTSASIIIMDEFASK